MQNARILPVLALFCLGAAATHQLRAQTSGNGAPPAYVAPDPTVTTAMGDPGGLFFGKAPDPEKTRHYYIAAEPVTWDYAPEGKDPICGRPFPPALQHSTSAQKIRYVQYEDAGFTKRIIPTERLGILGPVLRGVTGEYLAVTFLNRAPQPLSMHPHGVRYDKDSEGAYYSPGTGRGSAIGQGAKFTYVWQLNEASAPLPTEPSSKAWLYHSHVTAADVNLGLVGFIIVTDPARARPDGTPKDVDREMPALFTIFDESNIPDGDEPITSATVIPGSWTQLQQLTEEGERHTINGRTYGNLVGLDMKEGERVRWYLFGIGSELDFHTAHWHGESVIEDGHRRTDVVELLPASMKVADMLADNPGSWLLHCHVAEHMEMGMFARFIVHPKNRAEAIPRTVPAFFGLAASERSLLIESCHLTLDPAAPDSAELTFSGEVMLPPAFSTTSKPFTVQVGSKNIEFEPDSSGIALAKGGMLLVKNPTTDRKESSAEGVLRFDLTLTGGDWVAELEKLKLLKDGVLIPEAGLKLTVTVGDGKHSGSAIIKRTAP